MKRPPRGSSLRLFYRKPLRKKHGVWCSSVETETRFIRQGTSEAGDCDGAWCGQRGEERSWNQITSRCKRGKISVKCGWPHFATQVPCRPVNNRHYHLPTSRWLPGKQIQKKCFHINEGSTVILFLMRRKQPMRCISKWRHIKHDAAGTSIIDLISHTQWFIIVTPLLVIEMYLFFMTVIVFPKFVSRGWWDPVRSANARQQHEPLLAIRGAVHTEDLQELSSYDNGDKRYRNAFLVGQLLHFCFGVCACVRAGRRHKWMGGSTVKSRVLLTKTKFYSRKNNNFESTPIKSSTFNFVICIFL
jgi:hypothetical protein